MEARGVREVREAAKEAVKRRKELRLEKEEERMVKEVERKEKERREEQEAMRQGMAIENNNPGDPVGAEVMEAGLVQGGGEGEALEEPPGGGEAVQEPTGGADQAEGSEEEEDVVGLVLQDQAEYARRKEEKEEGILARMPINLLELTAELAVLEGLSERQHMFLIAGVYELCGKSCMHEAENLK